MLTNDDPHAPIPLPGYGPLPQYAAPPRETVAHAEVVAIPPAAGAPPPDGAVQLAWLDKDGVSRRADVVQWWRLDRGKLCTGSVVRVDVQARQRRSMASPPHHLSATLILTGVVTDRAQVMIGDPDRAGGWAYGVVFHGAILIASAVPVNG